MVKAPFTLDCFFFLRVYSYVVMYFCDFSTSHLTFCVVIYVCGQQEVKYEFEKITRVHNLILGEKNPIANGAHDRKRPQCTVCI